MFDVVILVGGFGIDFVPYKCVRELCQAATPGGFICFICGSHKREVEYGYVSALENELQLMVDKGLWTPVEIKKVDRYMCTTSKRDNKDVQDEEYTAGAAYLYRKSSF
ncbi:hypothetical protein LDENG_00202750 [Lucifuga dentata]|nr:hypothetical protein LDENG_00202750 [Lucifuga dentata]